MSDFISGNEATTNISESEDELLLRLEESRGDMMNEKFLKLPKERQRQMLNAGFKVFSSFPYRKAPTSSIAEAAGISKALLFHYFENKKGFYLYLFETALKIADR